MTDEELRVLAWTLLGEAGGEGTNGMAAVAHVIRNRSQSGRFPSNPASVATQGSNTRYAQFSAWNSTNNGGNNPRARFPVGSASFNKAMTVVERVFSARPGNDPTRGATHYYAPSGMAGGAAPYWWNSEAPLGGKRIGGHIFAQKRTTDPVSPKPQVNKQRQIGYAPTKPELEVFRTGKPLRLPDISPSKANDPGGLGRTTKISVYDPVRKAWVERTPSASDLVRRVGSAKKVQTTAAQEYAARVGHTPGRNISFQRNEQLYVRSATSTASKKPATQVVAGFSVGGSGTVAARGATAKGQNAKSNIAAQRAEQRVVRTKPGVQTQFAQPAGSVITTKKQDRLTTTLPAFVEPLTPKKVAPVPANRPGGKVAPVPFDRPKKVAPVPKPTIQRQPVVSKRPPLEILVEGANIEQVIRTKPTASPPERAKSVVQTLRDQGYSPQGAYDRANEMARENARANATNGRTSSVGDYNPDHGTINSGQ